MSFIKVKAIDGQECAIRVDTIVFVRSISQDTCEIGYVAANESYKITVGRSADSVLDEIELTKHYDMMCAKDWGKNMQSCP